MRYSKATGEPSLAAPGQGILLREQRGRFNMIFSMR